MPESDLKCIERKAMRRSPVVYYFQGLVELFAGTQIRVAQNLASGVNLFP
jgi:hypothetical protein